MTTFFGITGVIAIAFLLCLAVSTKFLEGTARLLTAHRLALVAYREEWARQRPSRRSGDVARLKAVVMEREG